MPVFCGTELWGPKAVIPTNVLAPIPPFLVQTPCAKTAKSCAFCDCTPEFYGGILFLLLEKQGKLYFLQSSQTKGRGVLAAFATLVCQRNCVFLCKGTKLKIVMPVFCDTELRFGIEKAISCATALCQNPRIRRSRILGLFAGFRLGMRFCL